MSDCLFCRIISGEIPSEVIYQDDVMYVFRDINPQAPIHLLAIPKTHFDSLDSLARETDNPTGHMLAVIARERGRWGLAGGYRIVSNIGADGRQSVKHLHFHIIGGQALSERLG